MPGPLNSARREYRLFYLAGMPAEICGTDRLDRQRLLFMVREDYPGFKDALRKWVMGDTPRRGQIFEGNRSLVVCVG